MEPLQSIWVNVREYPEICMDVQVDQRKLSVQLRTLPFVKLVAIGEEITNFHAAPESDNSKILKNCCNAEPM